MSIPVRLFGIQEYAQEHADLHLVAQQIAEMQMVREKVYQMEQAHLALKQKYGTNLVLFGLTQLILLSSGMTRRFPAFIVSSKLEGAIRGHLGSAAFLKTQALRSKPLLRLVMVQAISLEVSWQAKVVKEDQDLLLHHHKQNSMDLLIKCHNHLQVYKDLHHLSQLSLAARIHQLLLRMATNSLHSLLHHQVLASSASSTVVQVVQPLLN